MVTINPHNNKPFAIGVQHGDLMLLRRVRSSKKLSPNQRNRWKVRCLSCGTELIVPEYYMKRKHNPKTHCGCKLKTSRTTHNEEYRIWLMMHQRCYNPSHVAYKHYGGRGISIHPDWNRQTEGLDELAAFEAFLSHIGPRPSKKHSVDRIDNDGNYEPGNVRWATDKQQRANQRPQK